MVKRKFGVRRFIAAFCRVLRGILCQRGLGHRNRSSSCSSPLHSTTVRFHQGLKGGPPAWRPRNGIAAGRCWYVRYEFRSPQNTARRPRYPRREGYAGGDPTFKRRQPTAGFKVIEYSPSMFSSRSSQSTRNASTRCDSRPPRRRRTRCSPGMDLRSDRGVPIRSNKPWKSTSPLWKYSASCSHQSSKRCKFRYGSRSWRKAASLHRSCDTAMTGFSGGVKNTTPSGGGTGFRAIGFN